MKNYAEELWPYLTVNGRISLRIFQTKFVEKIKTHILYSVIFFPRKSCRLWDNVEKCLRIRLATDDNIAWRMRFACCLTKATDTHSECVIFFRFSMTTVVSRTCLSLTFIPTERVLFNIIFLYPLCTNIFWAFLCWTKNNRQNYFSLCFETCMGY